MRLAQLREGLPDGVALSWEGLFGQRASCAEAPGG